MTQNEILADAISQVLVADGLTISDIKARTPRGFWKRVSNLIGKDWSHDKGLSQKWKRTQDELISIMSGHDPESLPALQPQPTLSTQQTLQPQQLAVSDIEKLVETLLDKRLSSIKEISHNTHNDFELAPKPMTIRGGAKGRKENRKYFNLSVAIDNNLYELFEQERDKLNIPKSRLLDSILWNHYNKPQLTYGLEQNSVGPDRDIQPI